MHIYIWSDAIECMLIESEMVESECCYEYSHWNEVQVTILWLWVTVSEFILLIAKIQRPRLLDVSSR